MSLLSFIFNAIVKWIPILYYKFFLFQVSNPITLLLNLEGVMPFEQVIMLSSDLRKRFNTHVLRIVYAYVNKIAIENDTNQSARS